ncbi:hypothetical protein OG596_21725 [Streptomyces sp. NBC_01102]|uniref:HAAS signaling domain-containing protein n=1 Tax=unclassified Streptomyces TaxID=2593676 RepID=UPI003865CC37|nr:hypothetical protein OG596_21725 [Streptomyces sp. NBC_01102]
MKTRENALVRAYLDTVEREAATLSPTRRQELLTDLTEHIAVALAESGTADDAGVRRVLDQLGDPRTVAESALAEEGAVAPAPAAPARRDRSGLIILLLLLTAPLMAANYYLGLFAAIAGISMLWTSHHWEGRQRVIGTLIPVSTPVTVLLGEIVAGLLLEDRGTLLGLGVVVVVALVLPVVGAVHLARTARR